MIASLDDIQPDCERFIDDTVAIHPSDGLIVAVWDFLDQLAHLCRCTATKLGYGGLYRVIAITIQHGAEPFFAKVQCCGLTMLMVSTTGEQYGYYILDEDLQPRPHDLPAALRPLVDLIGENCEAALCTVLSMGGGRIATVRRNTQSGAANAICAG